MIDECSHLCIDYQHTQAMFRQKGVIGSNQEILDFTQEQFIYLHHAYERIRAEEAIALICQSDIEPKYKKRQINECTWKAPPVSPFYYGLTTKYVEGIMREKQEEADDVMRELWRIKNANKHRPNT